MTAWTRLGRTLALSFRALFAHRLRATLAVASAGGGRSAMVLNGAVATGVERGVQRSIESLGVNLLVVRPVPVKRFVGRKELKGNVTTLRLADAEALAGLPRVAAVAPALEGAVRVKAGASSTMTTV